MSDRKQVSNIIARLYDYIDGYKTNIFILISISVFLSPYLEDWQLFGNKLTKLCTFILVSYCILVVIGFVNRYRNKKDIKLKIEGIKELYKHKIGNIIYYSLQTTIKVINKLLKHLGKKEINSKKRMSSIIKTSNKVLKFLGKKKLSLMTLG